MLAISLRLVALLIAFPVACFAGEPVFTPPSGYVENAPDGEFECPKGMRPMLTRKEFRQFALRNEVWPQDDSVDLSPASWSAGTVVHRPPSSSFRPGGKKPRPFRAKAYVLVGSSGEVLGKTVVCSSRPEYAPAILDYLDLFEYEPSRYKGRGLNTLLLMDFEF
ncbi:MAG: hypothetical protein KIS72_09620 [Luteimonas sp.]|nr:hypothetical protein [Luteimonas sp.]